MCDCLCQDCCSIVFFFISLVLLTLDFVTSSGGSPTDDLSFKNKVQTTALVLKILEGIYLVVFTIYTVVEYCECPKKVKSKDDACLSKFWTIFTSKWMIFVSFILFIVFDIGDICHTINPETDVLSVMMPFAPWAKGIEFTYMLVVTVYKIYKCCCADDEPEYKKLPKNEFV